MRKLLFCEVPISGKICGEAAFYRWTPRKNPTRGQFMCKEHGELTAGNFTDELREIGRRVSRSEQPNTATN